MVYPVRCNESLGFDVTTDEHSYHIHAAVLGQAGATFDVGQVHYAEINDVKYPCRQKGNSDRPHDFCDSLETSRTNRGWIVLWQLRWLAKAIKSVAANSRVLRNVHIPSLTCMIQASSQRQDGCLTACCAPLQRGGAGVVLSAYVDRVAGSCPRQHYAARRGAAAELGLCPSGLLGGRPLAVWCESDANQCSKTRVGALGASCACCSGASQACWFAADVLWLAAWERTQMGQEEGFVAALDATALSRQVSPPCCASRSDSGATSKPSFELCGGLRRTGPPGSIGAIERGRGRPIQVPSGRWRFRQICLMKRARPRQPRWTPMVAGTVTGLLSRWPRSGHSPTSVATFLNRTDSR